MKKVVFACVHNAGRSQMAAAWFNHLVQPRALNSGSETLTERPAAISAGTEPAERVHPEVVEVMKEVGIDLSTARPQQLTAELASDAQLLVTMGCGDKCPYVPGLKVGQAGRGVRGLAGEDREQGGADRPPLFGDLHFSPSESSARGGHL